MKPKTKRRLLTFSLLGLILIVFPLKFIGYHHKEDKGIIGFFGRLLNNTNEFDVTFENVDPADVDVFWRSEDGSDVLVTNGVIKENKNYDYGPEKFTVFYKDQFLVSNSFFSTNNNDVYDVEIHIKKTKNRFEVTYLIDSDKTTFYLDNDRRILNER